MSPVSLDTLCDPLENCFKKYLVCKRVRYPTSLVPRPPFRLVSYMILPLDTAVTTKCGDILISDITFEAVGNARFVL